MQRAGKGKEAGICALETKLSEFSSKTNDEEDFWKYLRAKREFDESKAHEFYTRRNWRMSRFTASKSSKDKFLNKVASTYGKECHIFYGNWSRKDQMQGCEPSPTTGLKKAFKQRFAVTEVDEYLTSKTCNRCMARLSSYRKRDGKMSYTRLCCQNCGRQKGRSKQFVDRDENAAANILLVGTSLPLRPEAMRRKRKRSREEGTECDEMNMQTCSRCCRNIK